MKRRSPGFGIVEVVVASALLAIVSIGVMKLLTNFSKDVGSLEQRGEILEAKNTIRRRLNCKRTFPTGLCFPQGNGLVALKDDFGNDIFPDVVTEPAPYGTSYPFGKTRIRTTCVPGELRIFIASAINAKTAWSNNPAVTTCQEVMGGTYQHQCPAGEVMNGINPTTLEPSCVVGQRVQAGRLGSFPGPMTTTVTVPTPFKPSQAMCASPRQAYVNSWKNCFCSLNGLTNNSVRFLIEFTAGNHLGGVTCEFDYVIVGQ